MFLVKVSKAAGGRCSVMSLEESLKMQGSNIITLRNFRGSI